MTWWGVGILLLATGYWLWGIQQQSVWFDEGWSAYAATQQTFAEAVNADPTNPPLYYLILNVVARGFGDTALALRWVSSLLGLLAIAFAYRLTTDWFGIETGVYAALLLAASPLLRWAAQEMRMYTLLALLVLVVVAAWQRVIKLDGAPQATTLPFQQRPLRWHLLLWAGELALLYAHNTGPVIVLWLNIVTVLVWLLRRRLCSPDWRLWLMGQFLVFVLWSPWFVSRFVLLGAANSAVTSAPVINLELAGQIWTAFWAGSWAMVGVEPALTLFAAVLAMVSPVLALLSLRRVTARWLLVHALVMIGSLVTGLLVLGNELHGRYLVMVVPLLLIVLAAGLSNVPFAPLRGLVLAVIVAVSIVSSTLAQNPLYQHDDARGMVRYYARNLEAHDTVLAWSYADRYDLAYYWERFAVTAQRVTLPEAADLPTVAPLLPTGGAVALNVWYTQRADFRGMLGCVLEHGSTNAPQQFVTYGMTNLLYPEPPPHLPQMQVHKSSFEVAALRRVAALPEFTAEQALCLPVEIELTQRTTGDLKLTLIAENALGWEVARTEAVFAQPDQRTSSQLAVGDVLTAYPLLRLPVGAPAGTYRLVMRLYTEENLSGFDVLSRNGGVSGKDLVLGSWVVNPGADWSQVERESTLPIVVNVPVSDDLRLLAHDIADGLTVVGGQTVRLSLLWGGLDDLPLLHLVNPATDEPIVSLPPPQTVGQSAVLTLDWREARLPLEVAGAEKLELRLPDGTTIATWVVDALPALVVAPAVEVAVAESLPGVGELIGYTVSESVGIDAPVAVELAWQAGEQAIEVNYTVFVQMLNADGQLIAQSDGVPMQGQRPTTTWRPAEYIVDRHELTFNAAAAPGWASLIVGMYDPTNGERVTLADGSDFIILSDEFMVHEE